MFKKIICGLLCIIIISLTGCEKNVSTENHDNKNEQAEEQNTINEDEFGLNKSNSDKADIENFTIDENIFGEDLNSYFLNYKDGCIVIRYKGTNQGGSFQEDVADVQMSPLSTFKILSTIILLEENIVTNVDEVIQWDGTVYQNENWNCDQTLRSAFENSVVWVYKELIDQVNPEILKGYLERTNYGNKDITAGGEFWLDSSLKISLKEQILLLENIYNNKYNFKLSTLNILKELMLLSQSDSCNLYGKTGKSSNGSNLFVGFIEVDMDVYFFAAYINEKSDVNLAKDVTFKIVENLFFE